MINKISLAIERANPKKKLNILTMPTHEGYQSALDKTGHNFYMLTGQNVKGWDFQTRPLPPNHYMLTGDMDFHIPRIKFDLILCQNRTAQFPVLNNIAKMLGLPMIVLEHTEPPPGLTKLQLTQVANMLGDFHVTITEHNLRSWDLPNRVNCAVIPHGIDTVAFSGWTGEDPIGVSMVNHFPSRDIFCGWNLWQHINQTIPMKLFGDNPTLNTESLRTPQDIARELGKCRFFLNTSQYSPVPLSMLEAMACGCPVVTTAKQEIPKIIENGVNGFISNDPNELVKYCNMLLNDYDLAAKIGQAGRETIKTRFSMEQFISNWNHVFSLVREKYS